MLPLLTVEAYEHKFTGEEIKYSIFSDLEIFSIHPVTGTFYNFFQVSVCVHWSIRKFLPQEQGLDILRVLPSNNSVTMSRSLVNPGTVVNLR